QALLTGGDLEAPTQDQFAFFLFNEDEARAKLPRDFLTDDQSAHRRRNHGGRAERTHFGRQRGAEPLDDGHLLKRKGALEKLPAVQAAAEDEVAFEQRAGLAEKLKGVVVRHGGASNTAQPGVTMRKPQPESGIRRSARANEGSEATAGGQI